MACMSLVLDMARFAPRCFSCKGIAPWHGFKKQIIIISLSKCAKPSKMTWVCHWSQASCTPSAPIFILRMKQRNRAACRRKDKMRSHIYNMSQFLSILWIYTSLICPVVHTVQIWKMLVLSLLYWLLPRISWKRFKMCYSLLLVWRQ